MPLVTEIGSRLSSQSVATTGSTGWRLVYQDFVDGTSIPDTQVCVRNSGGFPGEARADLDRPTVQVMIRGSVSDSTGSTLTKAVAVNTALHRYDGTLSGWTYVDIERQGDLLYLGRDDNQRPLYSLNFTALRSRSS